MTITLRFDSDPRVSHQPAAEGGEGAGTRPRVPPMAPGEGARSRAEPVSPAEQHRLRGSFGWEVVSRRLASRLSQRALSAASGVSLRWLVTLEQGQGRPSDDVCRKLAAGFLPDGSELARAVLDLRLRRAAGESLVMWKRRRPPRVAVRRRYAEAAAVLDAEATKREAERAAGAAAFLAEFERQWHADAEASSRPPATPAEAWPGRWPRVRSPCHSPRGGRGGMPRPDPPHPLRAPRLLRQPEDF